MSDNAQVFTAWQRAIVAASLMEQSAWTNSEMTEALDAADRLRALAAQGPGGGEGR